MKTKTESILTVMNVIAWIVFIGLIAQAGAILVSYVVSLVSPKTATDLYLDADLYAVRQSRLGHYSFAIFAMAGVVVLKAYTARLVIRVLSKINLENPFTVEIAQLIEKLSNIILATWAASIAVNFHLEWLKDSSVRLEINSDALEIFFLAGIIFIIAQIFKKGIELQNENDLTV